MRKSLLFTSLLAIGLAMPFGAMAEEAAAPAAAAEPAPDWTFPSSISLVSDYIFRGQSQTWGKPAAQISVEADHKSGFYAGFFASNVSDEWLPGANLETDWYGGFRGSFASDFGYDVGGIYYYYPGANWDESGFNSKSNSLNTVEVYAAVSYKTFSLKGGRTLTEYWGWNNNNSGVGSCPTPNGFNGDCAAGVKPGGNTNGSYYFETNGSYEIFPTWTISGQIGRQWISAASGLDITYHKLGLTKAFSTGWSVGAFYSGTNTPDAYENFLSLRNTTSKSDIAKNTGFISVTKAF